MFMVNQLTGFGVAGTATPFMYEAIHENGFGGNAAVILDAADSACYSGSGQSFLDRSTNASTFNLGATSGAEASDPTFNGTAGVRSSAQYFSTDGADWFTVAANTTFLNGLHKSGSKFTSVAWVWNGASADTDSLLGCNGGTSAQHGHSVFFVTNKYRILFTKGDSVTNYFADTATSALTGQWAFVAYSFDQTSASNNVLFNQNGTQETLSINVAAPSATDASSAFQILAVGGGTIPAGNASRLAAFAMLNRNLSHAEISVLFNATRGRFGI